jgi:hypothetical protein
MVRRSDLATFLSASDRSGAILEASEDPSFSKHLVAPDDR